MPTSIPSTVRLLVQCWNRAEQRTSGQWSLRSPNADERFITEHFWESLNDELVKATKDGALARAFQDDLCHKYSSLAGAYAQLQEITHDMFMDCRLHNSRQEGLSGGDFGLVFARPSLRSSYPGLSIRMKEQGLLCQAKAQSKTGRWGKLTKRQIKVLPPNLNFTSLVLYESVEPQAPLKSFEWQTCAGYKIGDVQGWLAKGQFPDLQSSERTIQLLADGSIGTAAREIIDQVIRIEGRNELRIRIDWPDGSRPDQIHVLQPVQVHVLQR